MASVPRSAVRRLDAAVERCSLAKRATIAMLLSVGIDEASSALASADRRYRLSCFAVVAAIYLGTAVVSLFMALDNFDAGIKVGDEILFLVIGVLCICALAASVLWRRPHLPLNAVLVAIVVPVIALSVAGLLLDRAHHRVVVGEAVPGSVHTLFDIALLIVVSAPALSSVISSRRARLGVAVTATALTAIGWLSIVAALAIAYR